MWARLWHNLFRYLVQNPSSSITYYKIPMSKNGNFLFYFSIIFSLLEIACKFIQLQKILTVCLANPNEKFFISSSISFMIQAKQEITKITRIEWKGKMLGTSFLSTALELDFWKNRKVNIQFFKLTLYLNSVLFHEKANFSSANEWQLNHVNGRASFKSLYKFIINPCFQKNN